MAINKLYESLALAFVIKGFNKADEKSKEIYKQQAKDRDELLNKIARVLLIYTILDSVLSVSDNDKVKLSKEFSNVINNIAIGEFKTEKNIMQNIFETTTTDKYYSDAYIFNIGLNFDLKKLTDEQIKEIVDGKIDGELWSDRLWTNKKELETSLKQEIEKFLTGKTNVNKIEKIIKNKFNQNAFNTKRLIHTEVARCQSSANDIFAQEHGVREQMFVATLDDRTSKFCREHDSIVYKIDDPKKPILPYHPFERSVYINVPYSDWKPAVRKDNENKNIIDYKTYEQWLKDKGVEE